MCVNPSANAQDLPRNGRAFVIIFLGDLKEPKSLRSLKSAHRVNNTELLEPEKMWIKAAQTHSVSQAAAEVSLLRFSGITKARNV